MGEETPGVGEETPGVGEETPGVGDRERSGEGMFPFHLLPFLLPFRLLPSRLGGRFSLHYNSFQYTINQRGRDGQAY